MDSDVLVTPPTNEIITTAEAKTHLRVDHSNDDTLIGTLITAARANAEDWLGMCFLNTTWDYAIDAESKLLTVDAIELSKAPLATVSSITSYDDDNSGTTFSSNNYYVDIDKNPARPGRVALVDGNDWPTDMRLYKSLVIRYIAGWGNTTTPSPTTAAVTDIPTKYREWIKRAVLLTVAALYANRGDEIMENGLSKGTMNLLQPLRRIEF